MLSKPKILVSNGDFLLTQEAAAVLANISVQSLKKWEKQDNAPPRNTDGTYSAKEFGAWLSKHRASKRAGAKPPADAESRNNVEVRLKIAQAEKIEMENAVRNGELTETAPLEAAWQAILMRVRTRLLKIPTSLAPQLAYDSDPVSVQSKLKDDINEALTELSEDWREEEHDE